MEKKTQPVFYLASPYTHIDPRVKKERADAVTKAAIDLLYQNIFCFAPIGYNAPWEKFDEHISGLWDFWEAFDKSFVSLLSGIIVLQLDGWDESVGVSAEVDFANKIGKPVLYLTEEQIRNKDVSHILAVRDQILEENSNLYSAW